MTSFPTSTWAPTTKLDGFDWPQAAHVNDPQSEVVAIENYLREAATAATISGGVLTVTKSRHTVTPQTGTADDIDTISGIPSGTMLVLYATNPTTDTITFKHGTGNLSCFGGEDLALTKGFVLCYYNGSTVFITGGLTVPPSSLLTNRSGVTVSAGDVVLFDTANASSFTTTTNAVDLRVMGVVRTASIANNVAGQVYTMAGQVCTVNCDSAAVAIGQYLTTSTTAGKATAGSYFRENGNFAVALSSKAGGSTGTVSAMLIDNARQAVSGTSGWNMGGSTAVTTSQKFTIATETWATVAGAALPAARDDGNGMGYGTTAAYHTHGSSTGAAAGGTATRYKITYSTDTSSTLTASAVSRWRFRSGANFSSKGFAPGGQDTGSAYVGQVYRTTFSTDAEAAGGALLAGRANVLGVSDGTYVYLNGNTGSVSNATSKYDEATETAVDTVSAYLGTGVDGYCGISFPATAGYRVYKSGGTTYSRKLTYSTATDANNGSSPSGDCAYGSQVTDGVTVGYASGTASANKLVSSTGTYSTISNYPANINGASASNGAL